jgi:hypothetical protein
MMKLFRMVRVALYLPICLMFASAGNADRIYLKDGTVVASDKVWQTRGHVHFILKGTHNVEIRYANEIVAKIESQGKTFTPDNAPPPHPITNQRTSAPPKPVKKELDANEDVVSGAKRSPSSQVNVQVDKRTVTANRGLIFYDPRRGKRYWASRNSKHDTLAGALQALARQYGRTPQWVTSHMGEENNLSKIHASLFQRLEMETSTKGAQKSNQAQAKMLFYDDGREYPYHIGPDRCFKTRKEALKALARQYHQSEEWVNRRIGDQTDLDTIHRILEHAAANKPEKAPKSISSTVSQDSEIASYDGIEFYNPRREQKYWTGKMAGHNTLQEAMKTLAEQYGVSTEWIESNMGNTNDLSTIHRNIRKNLQFETTSSSKPSIPLLP